MFLAAGIEWFNTASLICKNSEFKLQDLTFPYVIYKKK